MNTPDPTDSQPHAADRLGRRPRPTIGAPWRGRILWLGASLGIAMLVWGFLVLDPRMLPQGGPTDTWIHGLAFGLLGLWFLLLADSLLYRAAALLGLLVLGAALEFGQGFVGHRSGAWEDGLANAVGLLVSALIYGGFEGGSACFARRRRRRVARRAAAAGVLTEP